MARTLVSKVLVTSTLAVGLAASLTLAAPAASASAKGQGLGAGPAHVRVDAGAGVIQTIEKTGKHTFRMWFRTDASGQWMGMRTDRKGRERTLVGDLNANRLLKHWGHLRLASRGARGSLAWDGPSGQEIAPVSVSIPVLTAKGVRFDFTSPRALPDTVKGASLNLLGAGSVMDRTVMDRSGMDRSGMAAPRWAITPAPGDVNITSDLWIQVADITASSVTTGIYDATTGKFCFAQTTLKASVNLPVDFFCDKILISDVVTYETPNHGAEFTVNSSGSQLAYNIWVSPTNENVFGFTHVVGSAS